jgi:hypothetical protein
MTSERDRPATDEIVVTTEMARAGLDVYLEREDAQQPDELVVLIYQAMESARSIGSFARTAKTAVMQQTVNRK